MFYVVPKLVVVAVNVSGKGGQYFWGFSDGECTQDYCIDLIFVVNDLGVFIGVLIGGEGFLFNSDVTMKVYVEFGQVQCVLVGWIGLEYEFSVVFSCGRVVLLKVCVFVDFLVEWFNFDVDYMQVVCSNCKYFFVVEQVVGGGDLVFLGVLVDVVVGQEWVRLVGELFEQVEVYY